jgi:hypothetical protein
MSFQCSAPTSNHRFVCEAEFLRTRFLTIFFLAKRMHYHDQARIVQMTAVNVRYIETWQEIDEQDRNCYIVGLRLQDEAFLEQLVHHLTPSPVLRILGLSVRDSIRICWDMDIFV